MKFRTWLTRRRLARIDSPTPVYGTVAQDLKHDPLADCGHNNETLLGDGWTVKCLDCGRVFR